MTTVEPEGWGPRTVWVVLDDDGVDSVHLTRESAEARSREFGGEVQQHEAQG